MLRYVIYDLKTGEYLTEGGEWCGEIVTDFPRHNRIPNDVWTYNSEEDATSGLRDVLGAWDSRYETPSESEFQIVPVKPFGWRAAL